MNRFSSKHYVPILRWKGAEQTALAKLYDNDSMFVTPLIEILPDNFVHKVKGGQNINLSPDEVINKIGEQITKCWGGRQFYLDLGLLPLSILHQSQSHFLVMLSQFANTLRLPLIPVIRITERDEYQAAVREAARLHNEGICVRLMGDDIKRPTLAEDIKCLLSSLQVDLEMVDLIVDYQIIEANFLKYDKLCQLIPNIQKWRNFIVASGAFPQDLSGLRKNDIHRLPRTDWKSWKDQAIAKSPVKRLPTYGDYTIQYPRYLEPSGQPMNYSASIRYTAEDDWVIMRGESVSSENGPGTAQWPANAALLREQPEYCGDSFSYGDSYIKEKSSTYDKPGSTTTWLRAGINHHMTLVVRQLAKLFDTSTAALS